MAHFAELDKDNKVLRVVVGCNKDIANNGGELSLEAEEHFKRSCPLSENGVRWVQTSYHNNFRKQFASLNCYYDEQKDKFILNQPYPSWTLDSNDDWTSPVARPTKTKTEEDIEILLPMVWDETNQVWKSDDNQHLWNTLNNSWDLV